MKKYTIKEISRIVNLVVKTTIDYNNQVASAFKNVIRTIS